MAIRLRTRLFLVVGALLAASILVSAVLSRQLTLVEVREFVTTAAAPGDARMILERAAAAALIEEPQRSSALAAIEEATGRRVLIFDTAGRIVAATSPELAAAQVRELGDGVFVGTVKMQDADAEIRVRGAPTRVVRTREGSQLSILLLPPIEDGPGRVIAQRVGGVPGWVWTTMAILVVAVPLVFAVSKRILGPVSAMTAAARRMRQGDLSVKVEARGDDELAELARAFNEMAARLAETERLRKQMVSDVAHELRSPVTNLRCTLEAIQDGLAVPDRASIDGLHDETLFLQRLIADLEEMALADAGQLTLRMGRVEIGALLQRVAGSVASSAGATIALDAAPGLAPVHADADRIEQVLRNLILNARTHTPADGRIEVRARQDGGWLQIDVVDSGSGIEADHLPHVFDRFYRADRSRSRATGGAGLGLAIARQLVTAHGGTITASSEGAGRGATFSVRLPAA
jgi:two-component system sensor histidine kinase BaeS